jgi:hypothetical protein
MHLQAALSMVTTATRVEPEARVASGREMADRTADPGGIMLRERLSVGLEPDRCRPMPPRAIRIFKVVGTCRLSKVRTASQRPKLTKS